MTDLAILYEHPAWFAPLFAALDRRGIDYADAAPRGRLRPGGDRRRRRRCVFNRIAMSSFLRSGEHPIFYADRAARSLARGRARG